MSKTIALKIVILILLFNKDRQAKLITFSTPINLIFTLFRRLRMLISWYFCYAYIFYMCKWNGGIEGKQNMYFLFFILLFASILLRGRCGGLRVVVGFTPNCNQCLSPIPLCVHGEVYSIQHYLINFVSDLRQVGGFFRFPPAIKLTSTI